AHHRRTVWRHRGGGASGLGVFYSLDLGLPPFVSILPPLTVGMVGKTIELLGQGFIGTSTVSFNGARALSFTVVSDTYLTAKVPNGATTGFVTVTTPSRTLTSNKKFRVTPQIKSFTPDSGPVGSAVTITGVSLTQTTRVTIGGINAKFTVDSDSTVRAVVPTGAVTGKKIGVTTLGGTATSLSIFTVM
ncbi:MAG TPA: IPT/TIG domain-containing protein, partial [Terriglobales bacterium]|nr:IPT/TIG domain-containing protein [Terriglobales bacterium]